MKRRTALFVIPAWAALAVELLGAWRFGLDPYSRKYAIDLAEDIPPGLMVSTRNSPAPDGRVVTFEQVLVEVRNP
ncbi:MAG TPA: hypothetical protein VFZ27_13825 [Terriglobia bacterium]|nr:hypothetical protein [Terriglobia bacterium]